MAKNVVPEAKDALNRFKMEAANEVGVPNTSKSLAAFLLSQFVSFTNKLIDNLYRLFARRIFVSCSFISFR